MIINIPFEGFYESKHSGELDSVEERFINYEIEERRENLEPEELGDLIYRSANYSIAFDHIARAYVTYFNDYIKEEYEIDLELKFESMQSPREYNFETDRIFCHISQEKAQLLFDNTSTPALRQAIHDRFTSRSGFISSYPNRLENWPISIEEWDHNQLGTLLVALLSDAEDYDWKIWEDMQDHNVYDTAFDKCVDWVRYDDLKRDIISEKEAV
jgi:hypothetical protein